MRYSSKRLMAAIVVAAGMPLALLAVPGAARASVGPPPLPCQGQICDGHDPALTYVSGSDPRVYCNTGSYTADELKIFGGLLELRWGPHCSTNWVRFTPSNNDTYEIGLYGSGPGADTVDIVGDGVGHLYRFSGQGIAFHSDQIYSPGPASPCIDDVTTNSGLYCFPDLQPS